MGFDVNFLWDFLEKGKHTLGLTLGASYRFSYYLSLKTSQNLKSMSNFSSEVGDCDFNPLMIHNFYPQIHYYFGKHQFELNYRFGGILSYGSTVQRSVDTSGLLPINTQILETNYFSFGYSYRF